MVYTPPRYRYGTCYLGRTDLAVGGLEFACSGRRRCLSLQTQTWQAQNPVSGVLTRMLGRSKPGIWVVQVRTGYPSLRVSGPYHASAPPFVSWVGGRFIPRQHPHRLGGGKGWQRESVLYPLCYHPSFVDPHYSHSLPFWLVVEGHDFTALDREIERMYICGQHSGLLERGRRRDCLHFHQ